MIVWHEKVDALIAAVLGDFAEDLVHLVVLVRGHVEIWAAVLPGVTRRTGIRTDQDGPGICHRLVYRLQDVGEYRPHDEIDLVAFQQPLDLRHSGIRLELVIDRNDLDIAASHLAAEIFDRKDQPVA